MRQAYGTDTVGIVIQSYLRNRSGDLERLIAQDARVRLVKGGYWEPPAVAFNKKADIDRAFERDTELLLARGRLPAIASHDARILEHACRFAESLKLSKRQFEFQMLYGVRPDLQDSLVRQGYAVRCYVPYGGQWYAYFIGCIRKSLGDVVDRFTRAGRARRRALQTTALVRPQHR
jgi:proline dehydrogenase